MDPGGYANLDGREESLRTLTGGRSWLKMLVRVVAAMILLFLLDLVWIKGLAPLLGLDYFGVVEAVQGASLAGRPIGLVAYIAMGYGLATMASGYAEGARLGFVLYVIFDFTSTFMYHAWTIKVALLDTVWGTLLFTLIGGLLNELERIPQYHRLD
ncbi:hypothetical protein WJX73_005833 [Symbiochloris irregularis]|uniref:Uncharacterized protein n=1 Tax=Symbiochloris irregularis TaxID=706552 RepID=A0AAW1P3H7_9CHLO